MALYGRHGQGQVVLFTNRMDALFYKYGFADLGRVLGNAVLMGLADARNLVVQAPDYVDVTSQAQPGRRMVHLINFAVGKHMNTGWRHPGRNLVPVSDIQVRLRLEVGQTLREVRTATNEAVLVHRLEDAQGSQDGGSRWVHVTVPQLNDHEILIFEFA